MRDWLNTHHASNKNGAQWVELWNIATQSDFELAGLDDRRTPERSASSDMLEINLRRLAAFVYEQRTQDKTGAAHMLAVVAPGSHCDVAPSWLATEATAHSKMEHQRSERVKPGRGGSSGGGGGGGYQEQGGKSDGGKAFGKSDTGKGKGRGRGDGKGRGGDGPRTQG